MQELKCEHKQKISVLTENSFDGVGDVQLFSGGQGAEESSGVVGALEALGGLLHTLTVVHLQVNHRAAGRGQTNKIRRDDGLEKCILYSESLKFQINEKGH